MKIESHATMELVSLLAGIVVLDPLWDRKITGISHDSRTVKPGDLFLAYPGTQTDGRHYISHAIKQGAQAILAERTTAQDSIEVQQDIPIFYISDVQHHVGKVAARFYSHPSRRLNIMGVTGTNGKTSVAFHTAYLLQQARKRCGLIGTIGYGTANRLSSTQHTTPDAIKTQGLLSQFEQRGLSHVAMEVSSHAIEQGRVKQIEFDIAVFTNLSHDHLDYHESFEDYARVKKSLFQQFGLKAAVINVDDPIGEEIYQELPALVKPYRISMHQRDAELFASDIKTQTQSISAKVITPWGKGVLKAPLIGLFNLYNVMSVLAVLCINGVDFKKALKLISKIPCVPGRMQTIRKLRRATAIVDYAHTPDALEKALLALKNHTHGKLWCIFGCGGNRDEDKRPLMGKIAEQFADQVIITNDNPRQEAPEKILEDILKGIEKPEYVIIETCRQTAIELALSKAHKDDVILIAGKGHEDYQLVGDQCLKFSDAAVVEKFYQRQSLFNKRLVSR